MKKSESPQLSLGEERFKSDKRQLGGMLMLTGLPAIILPLAGIASSVGLDTEVGRGIPMAGFVGSIFVLTMGLANVPVGYLQTVHDYGNKYLTGLVILLTQLAWVPYITDLTAVGMATRDGVDWIPPINCKDGICDDHANKFVGAMGMLGVFGYGIGFLGSLGFIQFSLFAYQSAKPGDRSSCYFQSRLRFYSFALFLVGISQLLLGIMLLDNADGGALAAPVSVAMYFIYFPQISVAVGALQLLNSVYGMARSFGIMASGNSFLFTTLLQWWSTIVLQNLVQIGYSPGGEAAALAPSLVALTMGNSIMVAYLDYKMRATSESLTEDYYGEALLKADPASESADEAEEVDPDQPAAEEVDPEQQA